MVDDLAVSQPGVQDPLDEFLVGPSHFGGQRHSHALDQRPANDIPARVEVRARHAGCQHL